MAPKNKRPKKLETKDFILKNAISILQQEGTHRAMLDRAVKGNKKRARVEEVMKAIQSGSTFKAPGTQASRYAAMRPLAVNRVAEQAARNLGPSSSITPLDIELAMRRQGIDWLQPFAPGSPLTPYYGYNRMPRMRDYMPGYNVSTETRQTRIPYRTLKQLYDSYDVASICTRHALQSLRSMRPIYEALPTCEKNPTAELREVRRRLRKPDGIRPMAQWLFQHGMDVWRYDAGVIYRERDRAGNVKALRVPDGTLFAPMLEYYGDVPSGDAPAYMQFIEGIPWDWLRRTDVIYTPFWPQSTSPYGTPPLETVLINANTDMRLQLYFLQFFTSGQVPEAFAIAPEDQSDPTSLGEWQEAYNTWTQGDQRERWGLRWLPSGTTIVPYKPQEFTPDVAEYAMRRTVAAFGMVPHDLGFTDDVNRACYSEDTEVLTDTGWKSYWEVDTTERIATLNPDTHEVEYHIPSRLFVYDYEGEMIHFRSRHVDALVTPDHKMWVGNHSQDGVWEKVEAELLETRGDFWFMDNPSRPGHQLRWNKNVERVPYSGKVWCFHVQNHLFFTRRNGRVLIAGNTGDTQMDVQFRIATLPLVGYYEDILNPVIQTTWGFPVEIKFDTGREREDRLIEAKVHQIYVSIGAESPTEVRSSVLGKPTNPELIIPRFFDSARRGPIPAEYLIATAGEIDSRTGLPLPGSVKPRPYIPTGQTLATSEEGTTPATQPVERNVPKGPARPPGQADSNSAGVSERSSVPSEGPYPGGSGTRNPVLGESNPHTPSSPGYGNAALEARSPAARRVAQPNWTQTNTKKRKPYGAALKGQPEAAGILVVASDTGRCLLVQRAEDNHNEQAAGRFEVPGGHLDDGEDAWTAAQREWEEEVGCRLPAHGRQVGQWTDKGGKYLGFIYHVPTETSVQPAVERGEVENAVWFRPEDLADNPILREELQDQHLDDLAKKDLQRWRAQSRRRVSQGLAPRLFANSAIPNRISDLIWTNLEGARSREDVDGAFAKATGSAQPPALGTFHRRATAIVKQYTPQIQQAVLQTFPPAAVTSALSVAIGGAPSIIAAGGAAAGAAAGSAVAMAGTAAAVAILKSAVSAAALGAIVLALYRASYHEGAQEAAKVTGGGLPPTMTTYQEHPSGGLAEVLAQAGHTIQGINHTTINRIGDIIHAGIQNQTPTSDIAQQINEFLQTPRRAQEIAETEYARAWYAAVLEVYNQNGVNQLEWINQPGACGPCMENVAASPQPARNPKWPSGPIPVHPWTRCAVIPYRGKR